MYVIIKSILLIAMLLFFNSELMADHPIGINAYLGKWKWTNIERTSDATESPEKYLYMIKQDGNRITVEALESNDLVGNIKLNPYSMSFLRTFAKANPKSGAPNSLDVTLYPDVRSSSNLFDVKIIEIETMKVSVIDLMSPEDNGNESHSKGNIKNIIPNKLLKRSLDNIYTKQWDLREITCCDDKVSLKIVATNNSLHAIFEHRGNTAQIPAKIVDNTITISFELNEYDDMKNIPLFKAPRKYHLQLIPLCGYKDHLIIKGCSISGDDTACTYFMAFSK